MLCIMPLAKNEVKCIVAWNEGKDAAFLMQWSGIRYVYPITEEQITGRLNTSDGADYKIFSIKLDERLIGTIELMRIDLKAKRASVGRFLLDPALTGNGYGTKALKQFVKSVFNETPVTTLDLTVFDFNKSAIRCYEKTGFIKASETVRPNGWIAIQMEIKRKT